MPLLSWVPSVDDKVVSASFQLLTQSSISTTCHCFAEFLYFNPSVKGNLWKPLWSLRSGYAERKTERSVPPSSPISSLLQILWLFIMLSLYFSQNTSMLFSTNYTPYGLKKTCSEAYAEAYFMINTANCCFPPFSNFAGKYCYIASGNVIAGKKLLGAVASCKTTSITSA